MTNNTRQLTYPGVYPNENEIIPYSPRRQFDFMQETTNNGTITLDMMKEMSTDQIVELYKNGYRLETSPTSTIKTAQNGITVSSDVILLLGIGVLVYMFLKR